jgi:hypothetical protein
LLLKARAHYPNLFRKVRGERSDCIGENPRTATTICAIGF